MGTLFFGTTLYVLAYLKRVLLQQCDRIPEDLYTSSTFPDRIIGLETSTLTIDQIMMYWGQSRNDQQNLHCLILLHISPNNSVLAVVEIIYRISFMVTMLKWNISLALKVVIMITFGFIDRNGVLGIR